MSDVATGMAGLRPNAAAADSLRRPHTEPGLQEHESYLEMH